MNIEIEKTKYPGWADYTAYRVRSAYDFTCLVEWMKERNVTYFLLASGANGYIFQVRQNAALFELRWG